LFAVDLSTIKRALRTGGCRLELPSGADVHPLDQGKALSYRCPNHLTRNIPLRAIRRTLLSIDVCASTALTPVLMSRTTSEHRIRRRVAGDLEILRGLTAHEEPAPLAEVFGDDE